MATVTYIRPVESVHGKLKKTDAVGFAMRKASRAKYTTTRENWHQNYLTAEAENAAKQRQTKFTTASTKARERMLDPLQQAKDKKAFDSQTKYTTLYGYLFHLEWLKL